MCDVLQNRRDYSLGPTKLHKGPIKLHKLSHFNSRGIGPLTQEIGNDSLGRLIRAMGLSTEDVRKTTALTPPPPRLQTSASPWSRVAYAYITLISTI